MRCHYCGCSLTHNIPPRIDTDATIEHLNSRNTFPGGRPNLNKTIVIACRKCNEGRAADEVRGLGIERLRELAGRWPLAAPSAPGTRTAGEPSDAEVGDE